MELEEWIFRCSVHDKKIFLQCKINVRACGEILMNTSLLLITGNSKVVSDTYRLKLHDDHLKLMTGVLQELLMIISIAPFSRVLLFEPVLKTP